MQGVSAFGRRFTIIGPQKSAGERYMSSMDRTVVERYGVIRGDFEKAKTAKVIAERKDHQYLKRIEKPIHKKLVYMFVQVLANLLNLILYRSHSGTPHCFRSTLHVPVITRETITRACERNNFNSGNMPPEELKPVGGKVEHEELNEAVSGLKVEAAAAEEDDEEEEMVEGAATSDPTAKRKKSKKKKIKDALSSIGSSSSSSKAPTSADSPLPAESIDSLTAQQLQSIFAANPSLAQGMPSASVSNQRELREALKKMSAADIMTGMSQGKNAKDMGQYRFWSTQPVPRFDDPKIESQDASTLVAAAAEAQAGAAKETEEKSAPVKKPFKEGPIILQDKDQISKTPAPLVEGFEWSDLDVEDSKELAELYDLLCNHYVEDDEAMFRFNYSNETLFWALKAPEWRKSWHVGVRATKSRKLVAFISAIPVHLRVRENHINGSEVNFLVVHKKLRSKRLAPVLITEITRRINSEGIFQAVYTAGVVLPKPVASCRYYHRALDWEKLHAVEFSHLPPGSTKSRQILKYKLPERTATSGLRLMEKKDVDAVMKLLQRYLDRTAIAQEFNKAEVQHWFLDKETDPKSPKRVVWTYVVEDGAGKITDFFSFYGLESTVIQNSGSHRVVRAAYLYYYGTETAFEPQTNNERLRDRLNQLVKDALILAKQAKFDVFNALTLLDNPLFLTNQKFGPGSGQLHYYLFNYRTADIPSGVDKNNNADEKSMGGVGVLML